MCSTLRQGVDTDIELQEVEFRGGKVFAPGKGSLADALAAFGNSRGGRLVLGVKDNLQAQSLDPLQLDALVRYVRDTCIDSIKPSLDFEVYRVPVPESANDGVLVVVIPESAVVH